MEQLPLPDRSRIMDLSAFDDEDAEYLRFAAKQVKAGHHPEEALGDLIEAFCRTVPDWHGRRGDDEYCHLCRLLATQVGAQQVTAIEHERLSLRAQEQKLAHHVRAYAGEFEDEPTRPELDAVVQSFGQWAVTTYGLECTEQDYALSADRLDEDDWVSHMAEKPWVDIASFVGALKAARAHFGICPTELGRDSRGDFKRYYPRLEL